MESCGYALGIRDMSKRFGGIATTDRVNIRVRQGQISGIIGPNGVGKTTLFDVITGVYKLTEGDVTLYDRSIAGKLPYEIARSDIVRAFQNVHLFGDLDVYKNVHVAHQKDVAYNFRGSIIESRKYREEERVCANRCEETLKDMGLWEIRGHLADNLPYGIQKRLEVACALVTSPRILLLDEPAADIDKDESTVLASITKEIARKDKEITILVIDHHMDTIMDVCDEMTAINSDR